MTVETWKGDSLKHRIAELMAVPFVVDGIRRIPAGYTALEMATESLEAGDLYECQRWVDAGNGQHAIDAQWARAFQSSG